jgi:hypothetical protein
VARYFHAMQWTVGLDTDHCPLIYTKTTWLTSTTLLIGGEMEGPEEDSDEGKLEGPCSFVRRSTS